MNWNELAKQVREANEKWWTDLETGLPIVRNKGELLALVISELSEALEGERKNLMDDKLPHRRMAEVEMADAVIRILDFCGGFEIELPENMDGFVFTPENKGEANIDIATTICSAFLSQYHSISLKIKLAMAIIQIEQYCELHGYDLHGAIREKLDYNRTREDHSIEARRAANGKKF